MRRAGIRSRACGCTTGWSASQREDGEVGRQHLRAPRGARGLRARRADHVLLRRPLPPAHRVRRRAPAGEGQVREDPRGGAAAGPGPSPGVVGAAARAVLRGARGRLQHAARRWRRCSTGSGRPTAASGTVGDADLRGDARGARRSTNLLESRAARGARPGASSSASRARSARSGARLRRGGSPARARSARWAGRCATARPGRRLGRRRDRLRPQPGPRGDPGPRGGLAGLGDQDAAREPWLSRLRAGRRRGRRRSSNGGPARPSTRVCARRSRSSATRAPMS